MPPLIRTLRERLAPAERIDPEELELGLKWWMRNGLGAQAMDTLSVGAFTTAFALQLGASMVTIGFIAAIPHLTQILQMGGVYIDDRVRQRRAMSVLFTALSRPMFLLMATAALLPSPTSALALFIGAFTVRYAFTAFMSCGWNSWIRDLVPDARRGRLTSRRLAWMAVVSSVLGLAGGAFVDLWHGLRLGPPAAAYALLFCGAFVGGAYSTFCMTRMPEPRSSGPSADVALLHRLGQPYRDPNYRRLLVFVGAWTFAVNLAAPFFMVQMLQRLELQLSVVMALTLLSQAVNVLVLKNWGEIADRLSNKAVLRVCAPLFIGCIFAWTFTAFPERHALTIPLLVVIHVFTGVATAGVTLATGNIAMKLAPRGDSSTYLANNSLVTSASAGLAPIAGGLLAHFFTARELSLTLRWRAPRGEFAFDTLSISQWDFYFLMATVIGLFALLLLTRVQEVGRVRDDAVIVAMYLQAKRFVQGVSSIAGLHQGGDFPFGKLRARNARARSRRDGSGQRSRAGGEGAEVAGAPPATPPGRISRHRREPPRGPR